MRVTVVAMSVSPTQGGGVAEKAVRLSRALADAGTDTVLVSTDAGLAGDQRDDVRRRAGNAELVLLPCIRERFYLPDLRPSALRPLLEFVRDADVVLLLNHWTLINVLAWRRARRHGVPHVMLPAGAVPAFGRSRHLKVLYERLWGRRLMRSAAAWIATTELEAEALAEYGVPGSVTVIPNGIDPPPAVTPALPLPGFPAAPYLLFVGRLAPVKGPDLLLEAFVRVAGAHPDLHLVLAGPDEGLGATLDRRRRDAGLATRVHLPGYLDAEAKWAAYRDALLTVLPSRREAQSIVALEAGAAGCPLLATDVCGLPDIEQVAGGRIVGADERSLAEGLEMLLLDRDSLPHMGARLASHVLASYGWDALAPRYLDLLERARRGT